MGGGHLVGGDLDVVRGAGGTAENGSGADGHHRRGPDRQPLQAATPPVAARFADGWREPRRGVRVAAPPGPRSPRVGIEQVDLPPSAGAVGDAKTTWPAWRGRPARGTAAVGDERSRWRRRHQAWPSAPRERPGPTARSGPTTSDRRHQHNGGHHQRQGSRAAVQQQASHRSPQTMERRSLKPYTGPAALSRSAAGHSSRRGPHRRRERAGRVELRSDAPPNRPGTGPTASAPVDDREGSAWATATDTGTADGQRSRRQPTALLGAAAVGATGLVARRTGPAVVGPAHRRLSDRQAFLTSAAIRQPGSLPNPAVAPGTESLPEIEHIVVVMMENHSFDNMLGTLGPGRRVSRWERRASPPPSCPDGKGNLVHAFHMPSDCMTDGVGNDWNTGHRSYDNGTNQGFVIASTGETMGYFTPSDMPFTSGLAQTFPIADRWFCSAMAQTDPNRRYLFSGTSLGLINDTFPVGPAPQRNDLRQLQQVRHHLEGLLLRQPIAPGVHRALAASRPSATGFVHMTEFFQDAAAGTLPQFSLLEPNYSISSEENPQDVQFGDQYLADVVNAVMHGPEVVEDPDDLDLRRVGGLVRPRATSGRHPPRRHAPRPAAREPSRWVRPVRVPGTGRGHLALCPARTSSPTPSTTTPRS